MCRGCYLSDGSPTCDTPDVRKAAEAVEALYDHPSGIVGGALHVVTDDWNVDEGSLDACRARIGAIEKEARYPDDPPGLTALEQAAFDALKVLTPAERTAALGLKAGFWTLAGGENG